MTRVIHLQAWQCQGLPVNARGWQQQRRSSLRASESTCPADSYFGASSFQNHETTNLYCFKPPSWWPFVMAVLAALRNEYRNQTWGRHLLLSEPQSPSLHFSTAALLGPLGSMRSYGMKKERRSWKEHPVQPEMVSYLCPALLHCLDMSR